MVATVGTDGVPIAVVAGKSARIALQSTHWLARVLGGTADGWQVSVSIWRLGKASSTLVHSTHLTAATSPTTNLSKCNPSATSRYCFVSPCLYVFAKFSVSSLCLRFCVLLRLPLCSLSTSRSALRQHFHWLLTGSGCAQVDTCRVTGATPGDTGRS